MKAFEQIQQSLDQRAEKIADYLERLSLRERIMVVSAAIVVIVAAVGSALFYMHKAAEFQQKRLNGLKDTIVWMQSNAAAVRRADSDCGDA